jgi:hypothetical protein
MTAQTLLYVYRLCVWGGGGSVEKAKRESKEIAQQKQKEQGLKYCGAVVQHRQPNFYPQRTQINCKKRENKERKGISDGTTEEEKEMKG